MVDGWAGIAGEIFRLKPLVIFHLKNMFWVKTERDRDRAMDPGSVDFPETLPSLQLYFLLGLVYAVVTPILLPFIIMFFLFAFLVYRHQEATEKDEQEQGGEADNLKAQLCDAYLHPIFHSFEEVGFEEVTVNAVRVDKHQANVSSSPAPRKESPV